MLKGLQNKDSEIPPKGFKTRTQWQKEWNVSSSSAKKLINLGIESNVLTQVLVRIQTANGLRPIPHYGKVKKTVDR